MPEICQKSAVVFFNFGHTLKNVSHNYVFPAPNPTYPLYD